MSRPHIILLSGLLIVVVLSCVIVAVVTSSTNSESSTADSPTTFTAAVYEHVPSMPDTTFHAYSRHEAVEVMEKNLRVYEDQAKKAKQQGAQIIAFPEDGLYGFRFNRTSVQPFLEKIPDPKVTQWSPCSDPSRHTDTEVQHALSCMAKENGMYVVANMGDNVPCLKADPKCPSDGHYQFNTDVAFGPDGRLLAKYHKAHLFYESQFDTPEPEVVYFDTPFGRFGLLICFDVLFKEPGVTMVTEHNITNVVFLTAWMDALPLLSAIGYHSSFARGLGVNFLSANIHLPVLRFQGSGIYTPNGMANFYYDNNVLSPGKLLISTIDIVKADTKHKGEIGNESEKKVSTILTNDFNATGDEFQAKLFDDLFTFKKLQDLSGNLNVCQRNVCCSLTYNLSEEARKHQDMFAFGVYDGLHTYEGQYYFQICTLVKCGNSLDRESCGSATKVSNTKFQSLSITGQFQTKFIYPQVIFSRNGQLALGDRTSWSFHGNSLISGPDFDEPLLSATLYGRYYCRDDGVSTTCDDKPVDTIKETV